VPLQKIKAHRAFRVKRVNFVKTDSLLYRLFNTFPSIFFDLIGQCPQEGYEFRSVEVKETAHRIDGVFLPPTIALNYPAFIREEIMQVLELATEAKQTRFYKEVLQEGRAEE